MLRFVAGFLVGFFLASALVFTFVQTNLAPFYEEFKMSQPYVNEAYNITHSEKYVQIEEFVMKLNLAGSALSAVPIIGAGVDATHINEYSQKLLDLMRNTRRATEKMTVLVSTAIAAIEMAAWGYWVSIIMVLAGFGLFAYALRKPAPAAKGKPPAKAKGRR
jgi:hypothetical protein